MIFKSSKLSSHFHHEKEIFSIRFFNINIDTNDCQLLRLDLIIALLGHTIAKDRKTVIMEFTSRHKHMNTMLIIRLF